MICLQRTKSREKTTGEVWIGDMGIEGNPTGDKREGED